MTIATVSPTASACSVGDTRRARHSDGNARAADRRHRARLHVRPRYRHDQRRLFVARWHDDSVNRFNVAVQPGAFEPVRAGDRRRARAALSPEGAVVARDGRVPRRGDRSCVRLHRGDSAADRDRHRRRHLRSALGRHLGASPRAGALAVIGADAGTVRRAVVLESATIGAMGAALGAVVGLVTGWIWIGSTSAISGLHARLPLRVPPRAAWGRPDPAPDGRRRCVAARRATREPILDGIRTE